MWMARPVVGSLFAGPPWPVREDLLDKLGDDDDDDDEDELLEELVEDRSSLSTCHSSSVWGISWSSSRVLNSKLMKKKAGGKRRQARILNAGFLRILRPPIHKSAMIDCERGWAMNLRF